MLPKREAQRHKDAFEYYYKMPKRSKAKVAKRFSVSTGAVNNWSRAFNWPDRIAKRGIKADAKTEEKVTDAIAEMNTRHIKAAKLLQYKALSTLSQKDFKKAVETINALKIGIELERQARGEHQDDDIPKLKVILVKEQPDEADE